MGIREGTPKLGDAALESTLARLCFDGYLSEPEYHAGMRYGQIALRYLESIDAPAPYGEGDELRHLTDEQCFQRKIVYSQTCEILRQAGKGCKTAVDRLAVYGESPRDGREWADLKQGLRALGNITD